MEVHLSAELEKQLNDVAAKTGRDAGELAQDVIAGYLDELANVRGSLDSRYDDLKSGRVKPVSAAEVKARLAAKSAAWRAGRQ